MPGLQVVDLNPTPRSQTTALEKTISGFTDRLRQNQVEQQESDALSDIYRQYQSDGKNLENAIQSIQTRPGISPTTRVNSVNQLLKFQEHNQELQKTALKQQEDQRKKDANQTVLRDIEARRGLKSGELAAYGDDPKMAEQLTRPEKPAKEKNPIGGLGGIPLSDQEASDIDRVIKENPGASAEELEIAFNKAKIVPGRTKEILESRRRREEFGSKRLDEEKKEGQRQKEFFHTETKKFDDSLSDQSVAAQKKNRALENQLKIANKLGTWDRVVSSLAGQSKWGDLLKSSSAQEFDSYSLPQMEGLREILGGVLSDSDIRLIMQKVVTSSKTPLANEKIAKYLMSENNYIIDKKNIADEIKRNNSGYRPYNFQSEVDRIFNERYGNQIKQQYQDLMTLPDDPKKLNKVGRRIVPPGTPLGESSIKMYMELTNGDPVKASQLAEEDGYDFPK